MLCCMKITFIINNKLSVGLHMFFDTKSTVSKHNLIS